MSIAAEQCYWRQTNFDKSAKASKHAADCEVAPITVYSIICGL